MSLRACQYMLLPCCAHGRGKMISRGSSSAAYVRSVKNAGMSRLLTQNDACGFGAIEITSSAAAAIFAVREVDEFANQIAAITANTRNAYIIKRTGSTIEIKGNRLVNPHGSGNPGLPAMWSDEPIAAT